MGIEAAVLGAGASLIGSALDRRAQGKAVNQANEAAAAQTQAANEASAARTQAGLSALAPGYEASRNLRQQALGMGNEMRQQGTRQGLGMIGQLYGPVAGLTQQGYMDAQRALLAGLPLQRAAIMGTPIDYSRLQPSRIQYDPQLLAGLFAGQELPRGGM